jgi:ATP-dependent Clp endopeptidase proteolytic subunit ClpP
VLRRKIYITGDIDEQSYLAFSKRLTVLENDKKSGTKVEVELSSGGGETYYGLAFASRMRLAKCPLHVTAHGLVASAAVLILAYGTKGFRFMTREARVMVHEDSAKLKGEKTYLKKEIAEIEALDDHWNELMEARTGTLAREWIELDKSTTYLSAEECLNLGLVDKVI